jgi:hypothetical protein
MIGKSLLDLYVRGTLVQLRQLKLPPYFNSDMYPLYVIGLTFGIAAYPVLNVSIFWKGRLDERLIFTRIICSTFN